MKYIAKIAIVLFTFWLAIPTVAQTPKKEVRAFWLSTVWRLTWPKTTVISNTGNAQEIQEQKDELIMLLDSVKAANANTVYFQVRGRCDAMYKSSYEPWSSDLVATRGMDPGYDPLLFAVEEAHKRGIEIHAWFNPYRYESVLHQWDGTPQNYRESHPEWLLDYSDGSILNPAMPEVRDRHYSRSRTKLRHRRCCLRRLFLHVGDDRRHGRRVIPAIQPRQPLSGRLATSECK